MAKIIAKIPDEKAEEQFELLYEKYPELLGMSKDAIVTMAWNYWVELKIKKKNKKSKKTKRNNK
jgi:hypothetical protein